MVSAGAVRVHPSVCSANVAKEEAAVRLLRHGLRERQQDIMVEAPPDESLPEVMSSVGVRPSRLLSHIFRLFLFLLKCLFQIVFLC